MRLCFIEQQDGRPSARIGREEISLDIVPRSVRSDCLLFPVRLDASKWLELEEALSPGSPDAGTTVHLSVNFQKEGAVLHVDANRFVVRLTDEERGNLAEYFLAVDSKSLGLTEECYRFQRTYAKNYASGRYLAALQ